MGLVDKLSHVLDPHSHPSTLSPGQATPNDAFQYGAPTSPQPSPPASSYADHNEALLAEACQQQGDYAHVPEWTAEDEASVDRALNWVRRPHQSLSQTSRLPGPVCIPQERAGVYENFLRAYAPVLASHDIGVQEFMQFLDHLNICKAESPPMHVLHTVGIVAKFIPHAQLLHMAGTAMRYGAQAAGLTISGGRVKRYVERSNEEFFHPRGLRVALKKSDDVEAMLHLPPHHPVLAPIPPSCPIDQYPSLSERRLAALQGHCAPLQTHDLPRSSVPTTGMDRWSAKHAAEQQAKRDEDRVKDVADHHEKVGEKQLKAQEDIAKARRDYEDEVRKSPRKERDARKKLDEEIEKAMKDVRDEEKKATKKVDGGTEAHEIHQAKKLLWVVIQNYDDLNR